MKWGASNTVTVMGMVTECVVARGVVLPVPVSVAVKLFAAVERVVATVNVDEPEPPARETLVGFNDKDGAPIVGEMEAVKLTMPVKPPRPWTVMLVVAEKPCSTVTLAGVATRLKF
jgi:hypothetical protein